MYHMYMLYNMYVHVYMIRVYFLYERGSGLARHARIF